MSAPATNRRPSGDPNRELMRALGTTSYTAMPPDQHEWQKAETEHNPPLHRLWSWMVHNTLTWGHTTVEGEPKGYATSKDGLELHLEHAAKDLDMDPGNVRRAWREGAEMGLWRKGTVVEGKRKLFLCGKVAPPKDVPEEDEVEKVCTDLFHPCLRKLPPYMRDQILAKPPAEVKAIVCWYARHVEVERVSQAEVMAAVRMVLAKREDPKWSELGIEKRRLLEAGGDSETDADQAKARQARLASLLPQVESLVEAVTADVFAPGDPETDAALAASLAGDQSAPPRPQRSVQTRNDSVQRSDSAPYKHNSSGVQGEKTGSTLLPAPTSNRGQRAGGGGVSSSGEARDASPSSDGNAPVQVHAGASGLVGKATAEERETAVSLLVGIAQLQQKHPTKFVGDEVSPLSRADMATAIKMVRTVGMAEIPEFVLEIEQRAIDRALGHQLTIALISEIAGDFARGASKREAARRLEKQQDDKREALRKAAERNRQRDDELFERTERAWEEMPVTERMERLKTAAGELRADPHWSSAYKNASEQQRREQAETRAKRKLRAEIEVNPS